MQWLLRKVFQLWHVNLRLTHEPPVDTPESLRHGLFLICEQVRMVRPRKRSAVSANNLEHEAMRDQIAAMRSIIMLKTFETAVT
jgi:hypothetical protein